MGRVIFNSHYLVDLQDFGINVPLKDQRALKTLDFAKAQMMTIDNSFLPATMADVQKAHKESYCHRLQTNLDDVIAESYEFDNPTRFRPELKVRPFEELLDSHLWQCGGTIHAIQMAINDRSWCFNLGGGMHHADSDQGRGFCLINDIAIGLNIAFEQKKISKALVIDVDAHRGDGTASIFRNDSRVDTFSIHMKRGWPEGTRDLISSTLDVPIGVEEQHLYNEKLHTGLTSLLGPYDLVFVVLGADPYEHDQLEGTADLRLSILEIKQREKLLIEFIKSQRSASVFSLGGGYGDRSYEVYVQALGLIAHNL